VRIGIRIPARSTEAHITEFCDYAHGLRLCLEGNPLNDLCAVVSSGSGKETEWRNAGFRTWIELNIFWRALAVPGPYCVGEVDERGWRAEWESTA
jgi:hypothetical protein